MEKRTMEILNAATKRFYASQAESFAVSRQGAWAGWNELRESIATLVDGLAPGQKLRVLDVACGNLRFEKFLLSEFPQAEFEFYTVDATPELLDAHVPTQHIEMDIVDALVQGGELVFLPDGAQPCDLVVCFGFLHHVPTQQLRTRLLSQLIASVLSGGLAVATFWRFGSNEQLAESAREATATGLPELGLTASDLDPNDYLMGWQSKAGVYRYSHDFSDEEVDELLDAVAGDARVEERFVADGRGGNLNTYAVLRIGD